MCVCIIYINLNLPIHPTPTCLSWFNIMLLDCLQARRQFCDKVNEKFGLDIQVYYNEDLESYNFNYMNNIEAMAQDGIAGGEGNEQ